MSRHILKRLTVERPRAAVLLVLTALFLAFGADPVAAAAPSWAGGGPISPNGVFIGP
jgi:hypothetical protein